MMNLAFNVRRIKHKGNGKMFVCKSLIVGARKSEREKLLREVEILSRCNHRNIISIEDFFNIDVGIVFPFCTTILREKMAEVIGYKVNRRKMEMREAMQIGEQLSNGLTYLHSRNITHFSIRPENVGFIKKTLKLLNFGEAEKTHRESQKKGGMYPYDAAERFARSPKYWGNKCDIYSMSVVLFEMVTATLPTTKKNPHQIHSRKFGFDGPQELVKLLMLGLSNTPQDRPSAKCFSSKLKAIMAGQ